MKKTIAIAVTVIAVLSGMVIIVVDSARKSRITAVEPLKESIRSSILDDQQRQSIAAEMIMLLGRLTNSSSQQEYDVLLPLLLERNNKYRGGYVEFEWIESLKPELVKKPILKMLSREADDFAFAPAAFVAGTLDFQESTPLLIDYMTQRYAGRALPENASHDVICAARALSRYAYRGNKQASDFMLGHAKLDAWHDIDFTIPCGAVSLSGIGVARFMQGRIYDALIYYPCEASITALRGGEDKYAKPFVSLIDAYLLSGDSYDEYWKEVNAKGELRNKYMINSPYRHISTGRMDRDAESTNKYLIATPDGMVERVRTVRSSASTNSSLPVK